MLQTIEVEIDSEGRVHALGTGRSLPAGRGLLTLLMPLGNETAILSETALAEDWLRPEEDAAWADLQPVR